jgi:formiminotetrahydrofolate cyclodeaminase
VAVAAGRRLCDAAAIGALADTPLTVLLERIGSSAPVPGAGPAAALTCALAAALVEMVCGVSLRQARGTDAAALEARRERCAELRTGATGLAELDMAAYTAVLAARRGRSEPGGAELLHDALAAAADPPLAIAEAAAEVARLAAEALADARGAVRGEAATAALLAEAVVRAGAAMVELNLAGDPADPRRARASDLAAAAREDRERAAG